MLSLPDVTLGCTKCQSMCIPLFIHENSSALAAHKIDFVMEFKYMMDFMYVFKSQNILYLVLIYVTKVKSAKNQSFSLINWVANNQFKKYVI